MRNPFVIDRPLSDQDLFFGREDAFGQLQRGLRDGQQVFVLKGPVGSGKTSFVNQLSLRLTRRSVRTVQWSQAPASSPDTLARMQSLLERSLTQEPLSDAPQLICIDGIPLDMDLAQDDWAICVATILERLSLISQVALLLSIECAPGFRMPLSPATELPLTMLAEVDVQDLLMIPARRRLTWDLDTIQRIYRLTGGHPYFCQLYGHFIFERRFGAGWVSRPDVDDASATILERESDRFRAIWEACSPQAQLTACSLAEMPGRRDLGGAKDVAVYFRQLRIEAPLEDIQAALRELADLSVLSRLGGETYRFRAELMRQWIRMHHKVLVVVDQHKAFRQYHQKPSSPLRSDRIDWIGLGLWVVAAMMVLAIAFVWRSRQTTIFWTATPTPDQVSMPATVEERELPTPEKGVAPGHIAYQSKAEVDRYWSIYTMRSDGSDPVRLTGEGSNDTGPVWSPDGRRIVFVSDRDGNREIYVMNSDGNDQVNLTVHGAEDWTPAWSPDGERIAFASFREGNWDLYTMRGDGSELERLTEAPSSEYSPSWSPDGELLAFVSNRDGNLDIYVMTIDGQETWRVTEDDATDQTPSWSPDGAQLIWESYRENNMELFVANSDGSEMRALSRDAYADDHGACWSPWGRRVVFYSNRDEGWDIYTLDVESGERVNLTMSPMLEQAPHWGP